MSTTIRAMIDKELYQDVKKLQNEMAKELGIVVPFTVASRFYQRLRKDGTITAKIGGKNIEITQNL